MSDFSNTIINFGKYKGKEIGEIPSNYVKWLSENSYDEDICCDADQEYKYRTAMNSHFWED